MNKTDEVICTVKGFFNGKKHKTTLYLVNRESNWILIENRGSSSPSTSSSSSDRPNSKNSKVVSYIDGSFYHTFTNSGASQWRIEWNNADQTRLYFQSDSAVEARSLDRGFRIITNDINNSTMSSSSSASSICTRYSNEYSLEPHYLQQTNLSSTTNVPILKKQKNKPQTNKRTHCQHCGRKYFTSRRSRCWAQFSSYLCCTSDFDV